MTYMSKKLYANMGVKISVWTSTIQPQDLNNQNISWNALNLKNIQWFDFLCIFLENPLYNEN